MDASRAEAGPLAEKAAPSATSEAVMPSGDRDTPAGGDLHAEIRSRALKLLTTREHSRLELSRKLRKRGYEATLVEIVLTELAEQDLLSEERLVAAYVAERLSKGFGPVRIRFELREKGLSDTQIDPYLQYGDDTLCEHLETACRKRFGDEPAAGWQERLKRSRFLEYRGFPPALISRVLERQDLADPKA